MTTWTFFDFVTVRSDGGRTNEIHAWLNSKEVTKDAKAKINARVATLQGFPIFPDQYFSAYKGWPGLYELRIVCSGVQYRPFGFYGPEQKQFTILVGSTEKGKVPKSTLKVANERRAIVIADPNRIALHDPS
jgi:Phage derived protein Gp49-like (DUF891)